MWKRDNEAGASLPPASPTANPGPSSRNDPEPMPTRSGDSGGRSVIGPSLEVSGDFTGSEDLYVEGKIRGKVELPQNAVTVGAKGRVTAEVHARVIHVEGEVEGNLRAEEMVTLRKSARVRGDLVSPRVVIEDGARFKGTVDMEPKRSSQPQPSGPRPVEPAAAAAPSPVAAPRQ